MFKSSLSQNSPNVYVLLVGLTKVDNDAYRANFDWYFPDLPGCQHDLDHMYDFMLEKHMNPVRLQDKREGHEATADNVLKHIDEAARTLEKGGLFIFYFTGHGMQIDDNSSHIGWTYKDGLDDVLICSDKPLFDVQLGNAWRQFKPGVRIVMISDSCHSGTNQAIRNQLRIQRNKLINLPFHTDRYMLPTYPDVMLVHYGACRDDEEAPAGGDEGSPYTYNFIGLCKYAVFELNYQVLGDAIAQKMEAYGVHAQFNTLGDTNTPEFKTFLHQRPFTIDFPVNLINVASDNMQMYPAPAVEANGIYLKKTEKFSVFEKTSSINSQMESRLKLNR